MSDCRSFGSVGWCKKDKDSQIVGFLVAEIDIFDMSLKVHASLISPQAASFAEETKFGSVPCECLL